MATMSMPSSSKSSLVEISSKRNLIISDEPIGFSGGDENLYRYVHNDPINSTDPSGLIDLRWNQKGADPGLDGAFGFEIKIQQTLTSGSSLSAKTGTQSWQTNEVKTIALVVVGDKTTWVEKSYKILDVNNIGSVPFHLTDNVGVKSDPNQPAQSYGLFVQIIKKVLGLRPFDDNFNFSASALSPGNGREASDEDWNLAQTMKGSPKLEALVKYVYFDRKYLRCATKDQLDQAATIFKGTTGHGIDPSNETYEYLSYSGIGSWFAVRGKSSSL
jgi:hypothetical protein